MLSLLFQTAGIAFCKEQNTNCKDFLSNPVSSEIIFQFLFHIFQVDYSKIPPISRVNIETISLSLYFTQNFITKLHVPSFTTSLQLPETYG